MKKKLIVLGSVLGLTPMLAFAATTCVAQPGTIGKIICQIGDILNAIIPVLVVLAIIYFIWGVIMYVIASDEEAKSAGRNRIIYGIIGLAVIVGVWGLVHILDATFNVGVGTINPVLPTVTY